MNGVRVDVTRTMGGGGHVSAEAADELIGRGLKGLPQEVDEEITQDREEERKATFVVELKVKGVQGA